MNPLAALIERLLTAVGRYRSRRRWNTLRNAGLHIGRNATVPDSTWIDAPFCYLISIGDNCSLGEECLILAHDAQMDEFLDAGRVGRVVIHPDCRIGARTSILPGVEIGPRTVVAPQSVVLRSLPPDSYCAGNPARVVSTLDELLGKSREELQHLPSYDRAAFERLQESVEGRAELRAALAAGGYVRGGGSTSGRAGQDG